MHGCLSPAQSEALIPFIRGRSVVDLGAGEGDLSEWLAENGAAKVVAVDKTPPGPGSYLHPAIYCVTGRFDALSDLVPDIAFVSWPVNQQQSGLFRILRNARMVIYLGKNTDGSSCGHPDMFEDMLRRELLVYLPERRNSLIVAGKSIPRPRKPTGEERAGIKMFDGAALTFEEAEKQ